MCIKNLTKKETQNLWDKETINDVIYSLFLKNLVLDSQLVSDEI